MNEMDLKMRDLDEELNKDGLDLALARCGHDAHCRCPDRGAGPQGLRNVADVSRMMQVMVEKELDQEFETPHEDEHVIS